MKGRRENAGLPSDKSSLLVGDAGQLTGPREETYMMD